MWGGYRDGLARWYTEAKVKVATYCEDIKLVKGARELVLWKVFGVKCFGFGCELKV